MAFNTTPSFMSGKSTMGGGSGNMLSNQIAGQRAVKRRPMGGGGNMMSMRPNPAMSKSFGGGGGGGVRPPGNGLPASTGMNPRFGGPSMGGPIANSPGMRMQGDPLMSAPPDMPPPPQPGGGMVMNSAPPMEMPQELPMSSMGDTGMADGLRQRMGGNTGIIGGMNLRNRPGMFSMY